MAHAFEQSHDAYARGDGAAAKALSPGGLALDVNAGNARARRFYARHGFVAGAAGTNPRSGLPTLTLHWGHTSDALSPKAEI